MESSGAAATGESQVQAVKPNKKSAEYRFAVNCDTPDGCKMMLAANEIKCCKLCPDDTSFFGHDPYYGFYEFVEKDPWEPPKQLRNSRSVMSALVSLPGEPVNPNLDRPSKLNDREKMGTLVPKDNPTLKAAAKLRAKYPPPSKTDPDFPAKCLPPEQDDFRLPCCQFCPRGTFSDSSTPFLIGTRFTSDGLFQKKKPCCAAPGSCCRWCPEYVCPYLQEYTVQTRLWWHICGSWNQDDFPRDWQSNTLGEWVGG